MTIWRPADPLDHDIVDTPGIDTKNKRRTSRHRAWRSGLAAQTVIENIEDNKAYRSFERAIVASFGPRSLIELELIHRLASLLWRLRRASAIEVGLLDIQSNLLVGYQQATDRQPSEAGLVETSSPTNGIKKVHGSNGRDTHQPGPSEKERPSNRRALTQCFIRLTDLGGCLLERAGAYEGRLWRQAAQTIWILDAIRRPPTAPVRPRFRKPLAPPWN